MRTRTDIAFQINDFYVFRIVSGTYYVQLDEARPRFGQEPPKKKSYFANSPPLKTVLCLFHPPCITRAFNQRPDGRGALNRRRCPCHSLPRGPALPQPFPSAFSSPVPQTYRRSSPHPLPPSRCAASSGLWRTGVDAHFVRRRQQSWDLRQHRAYAWM